LNLLKSLNELQKEIDAASKQFNRDPKEITIIAVTKTHHASVIALAISAGLKAIGENRVKEAEEKFPQLKQIDSIEKHFIGHLQSNKAKKAVELFDMIDSIDSLKLAEKINRHAKQQNKKQRGYIQIKYINDTDKSGFLADEINSAMQTIDQMKNLIIMGLMTIAPHTENKQTIREAFMKTRKTRDKLLLSGYKNCTDLSMGMSGDYKIAISEGATHLRIGTALFGERK